MAEDLDLKREMARLDYAAGTAEATERTKHQVLLVDRGLQGLTLINGGAMVGLFTLIGSNAHLAVAPTRLWGAFAAFALGLALAMCANLGAFLSQGFYYQVTQYQSWDAQRGMFGLAPERAEMIAAGYRRGQHAEFGGISAACLSLFAFILGCGFALAGVVPN